MLYCKYIYINIPLDISDDYHVCGEHLVNGCCPYHGKNTKLDEKRLSCAIVDYISDLQSSEVIQARKDILQVLEKIPEYIQSRKELTNVVLQERC